LSYCVEGFAIKMPEIMSLSDVDNFAASEEVWPSLVTSNYRPQSVADIIMSDVREEVVDREAARGSVAEIARQEQLATLYSVRESARPRTILHALLLEDGQSSAQIAALIGCNPLDKIFLQGVFALREIGMIVVDPNSKIDRYSLASVTPSDAIVVD